MSEGKGTDEAYVEKTEDPVMETEEAEEAETEASDDDGA